MVDVRVQRGAGVRPPPPPPENHKAAKLAFNCGPLSARQRNAISMAFASRPIIACFWWPLDPRSPKKRKEKKPLLELNPL